MINEDQIKQAMNLYADFQNKRELLNSQKQEIINTLIPLEIQQQISDVESEFSEKEEAVALEEKNARKTLDMMLAQFAKSQALTDVPIKIKSELATVSLAKGDVTWDSKSLDGYALNHTEILSFRKEEKPKIRVTRTKL